jgi:hypothetical protein
MPQTWTDKKTIHISDQLLETTSEQDQDILRELAMDYLNNAQAWVTSDDRVRCSFLGVDGHATTVTIGLATVGDFAAVSYCEAKGKSLMALAIPLKRVEEFDTDFVDEEYNSKPLVRRDVVMVRVGKTRPLRPMKYEPDEG